MATLNGIFSKMQGAVGNATFTHRNGKTFVSEKAASTTNARTAAQQRQRMKFANIVRFYKGIAPLINYGFENKPKGRSDYNMFVKYNTRAVPVYLTKPMSEQQSCVAAPYQLSLGTLPVIIVEKKGETFISSISLGSLAISKKTTVGELAEAVVMNNTQFAFNDQISFFNVSQEVNPTSGMPYCVFEATSAVLKKGSNELVVNTAGTRGFESIDGRLAFDAEGTQGCFCWVHSRKKDNSGTAVSSQWLIDNNPLLPDFTSQDAYYEAVATYGGESDSFLTPDAKAVKAAQASGTPSEGGGTPSQGGGSQTGGSTPSQGGGSQTGGSGSAEGGGSTTPGEGSDD